MMISFNRAALICLIVAQISCFLSNANAFVVPTGVSRAPSSTTLAKESESSSTELASSTRRRDIFGKLKKAVLAGSIVTAFRREPALADESPSPVTGRVVKMEIGNVDGEEGATGTVKIQLVSGASR